MRAIHTGRLKRRADLPEGSMTLEASYRGEAEKYRLLAETAEDPVIDLPLSFSSTWS